MPRPTNPEVRARLLAAGRAVVYEQGFNGSGVQDITDAAKVPKGSFYNYFDSKESFASDILADYWESIEQANLPVLQETRVKPVMRLRRFFEQMIERHQQAGFKRGCLIGNLSLELSASSEVARATLERLFARWQDALAACISEAQERGEVRSAHSAAELAGVLIESFEGALLRSKVERNDEACKRFLKFTLRRILG